MNFLQLPFISKVTENQQAFGEKVIQIADEMGMLPHWLMIVMNNESGLNSHIKNPTSTATGLIQFMEGTAKDLGTNTEALRLMSNVDQLDYVKKYFTKYGYNNKIDSVGSTYLAVFFAGALSKPIDFVFPQWATIANKIFDVNKDSILTKSEFLSYVNNKYAKYIPANEAELLALKKKVKK